MRQGQQQNRRGRGRGRKPQNPLARSFESNGPDVKIRGTAAHVAEKYMSLARDAHVSGDPVTAESYLQHAEHYNRIIMAAQAQAAPPAQAGEQANGHRGNRQGPEAGEEATPVVETAEASASEANAPRGERDRGRQGRNGSQPAPESSSPEPVEAAVADEGENTPDAVS